MANVKTIAFYLPQFYPIPENDEWWGKGFTEWTNVTKAKPLFPGHYQPRLPADLGFYDLRVPQVREQQAELARQAGIDGFCYWHYWFAGRRLLDQVFSEVVDSGKPDFPFCLCWANHSWAQKTWDSNPDKLIIEQTYPGRDDYIAHFNAMLPAFRDHRYIRVDGKLLFGIYAPSGLPDPDIFFDTWNKLAKENGLEPFCFFGFSQEGYQSWQGGYYDITVYDCLNEVSNHYELDGCFARLRKRLCRKLFKWPYTVDYDNYTKYAIQYYTNNSNITPSIVPDFDHSPRSGNKWVIMDGSTPQKWGEFYRDIKELLSQRGKSSVLFIKAWNEWAEGNYLEPDLKFGRQYLNEMAKYK